MRFFKMHGIGNDYVLLDAVTEPGLAERADLPELAGRMSDRHFGVGSDGLILVCAPTGRADVGMRMFNADGSGAEMCGNGVRCVAKLAHDRLGIRANPMRVETGRGVLSIEYRVEGGRRGRLTEARVNMGRPILEPGLIPVRLPGLVADRCAEMVVDVPIAGLLPIDEGDDWVRACGFDGRMTCVSMGNPHVVFFCDDVDVVPLDRIGPLLERLPIFPNRINVHFAEVRSRSRVKMRTWERGASLTLACGTGACAVVVGGVLSGRLGGGQLVEVELPGGELAVSFGDDVLMTGPAVEVFEGTWPDP